MDSFEPPPSENTFLKSGFFEQLVEHAFISEILQEVYFSYGQIIEVLRSEIDTSGFDLVLECLGVMRHVQLKTSKLTAKTAVQKVHSALAEKPSGCVVWVVRDHDPLTNRLILSYRFFGGGPGESLPPLTGFKVAKHTKGDSFGVKKERPAIRVVPKSSFRTIENTKTLAGDLFGFSREISCDHTSRTSLLRSDPEL